MNKIDELRKSSENRSKRVHILITPQTHARLKEISEDTGASVNEIINKAIESFIEDM